MYTRKLPLSLLIDLLHSITAIYIFEISGFKQCSICRGSRGLGLKTCITDLELLTMPLTNGCRNDDVIQLGHSILSRCFSSSRSVV